MVASKVSSRRLVVVTGCDTGFGRLYSETLAREHGHEYDILAGCLKSTSAEQLNALNLPNLVGVQWDVTQSDDVGRVCRLIQTRFGGSI